MGLQAAFEYSVPINNSFMGDKSSKLIMTAHISQFPLQIIAGHSNTDVGAVHGAAREADITQDMCNLVAHYLMQTGVQIRIDGTGKGNLPLREAVKLIKGARWPVSFIAMLLPISLQKGVEPLAHSRDKAINLPKHCKAVSSVMNNPLCGEAWFWLCFQEYNLNKIN